MIADQNIPACMLAQRQAQQTPEFEFKYKNKLVEAQWKFTGDIWYPEIEPSLNIVKIVKSRSEEEEKFLSIVTMEQLDSVVKSWCASAFLGMFI